MQLLNVLIILITILFINITCRKITKRVETSAKMSRFLKYTNEYNKFKKDNIRVNNMNSEFFNNEFKKGKVILNVYQTDKNLEISINEKNSTLIAQATYLRNRYNDGWDKLNIKTYENINPILQCYVSGLLEGILTFEEIEYYYNNIHVFFDGENESINEIKNFYAMIDKNIRKKIDIKNLSKIDTTDLLKWSFVVCTHAQLNGLHSGYNLISSNKLDLLDFYFLNSEGNIDDLKTFLMINKMDLSQSGDFNTAENLKKIYNTDNIDDIWNKLVRKGHCSALIKLIKNDRNEYDILSGHNTWSDYCEMLRSLKEVNYAFEGENIVLGMKPRKVIYSSYPGVLFSGDDFYLTDNKISLLQTTLNAINKYSYKDLLKVEDYVPEFMRIMASNFIAESGKEWVDIYKSWRDHMYVTQWLIIDYNILNKMNIHKNNVTEGLVYMVEEVPGSIKSIDLTEQIIKDSFFGSFNLAYFKEHRKTLGLESFKDKDFTTIKFNPRFYIYQELQKKITNITEFSKAIMYNGFKLNNTEIENDPSKSDPGNGISARDDLSSKSFHGGIDYKVVNKEYVENQKIYVYGGPTYGIELNIEPFEFDKMGELHKQYHKGIPDKWAFSPFNFP